MMATWALHEGAELASYESVIERGLQTFYEVGAALMAIRDARLYQAQHATFEDYCRTRWGFSRIQAHRLIDAADVRESLLPIGNTLPVNEAQSRPLAPLSLEHRREAWVAAVGTAENGVPTAAHVAAVVEQFRQPDRMAALFSSESPEWYTPAHVIAAVVDFFDAIDLDPCAEGSDPKTVPATWHLTAADDGLARQWWGRVYLNPPYGDAIGMWVAKLDAHYRAGDIEAGIALVPARTDTDWFAPLWEFPICFIHGRLKFDGPNGKGNSAGFPSALVYLGDEYERFARAVAHLGPVVRRYDTGAA